MSKRYAPIHRPCTAGSQEQRTIAVDDQAHALLRFASGARGTFSSSWLKHGYKNHLSFEISGTQGPLSFDQERLNELRLCRVGQDGFQRLLAGPNLPGYAAFSPAPGHQLGYKELKTLEVHELIMALTGHGQAGADFEQALEVGAAGDGDSIGGTGRTLGQYQRGLIAFKVVTNRR